MMDNDTVAVASANCCRLCLLDDGIKLPIFEGEGIQRQVALKIRTCFPILIYFGDPLPKMICHKCLFKLDSAYDFRLKCLETNSILKQRLLTMTHVAEVKHYLNNLESASCLRKEVTQEAVQVKQVMPVGRQVETSEPLVPDKKAPITEHKIGPVHTDSNSENAFQEVYLAGCSNDVFLSEHCPDDNALENGNNLAKLPSREQTVSTAPANSVDSVVSDCAVTIKQEPQDKSVKEDYPDECGKSKSVVVSQLPLPSSDSVHCTDVEPVSVVPGTVKQEKVDAAAVECSEGKVRLQDERELQKNVGAVLSQWSCEDCDKYFKSKETLHKHKKYFCHKKRSNFECRNCGKMFSSVTDMAQHQKVHLRVCVSLEEDSLYTCRVCRRKFAARSMLETHKKSHSSSNLYMNHTEDISVQPSISTGKVQLRRFKCQYCPSSYTTQSKLTLHVKTHFVIEENSSISECSVETRQSNKGDTASEVTPQCSKNFTCKYCEHAFDDSGALWNHMLQQHSSGKAFSCGKCGRSFRHLHAYSNHKKTHYARIYCRVCRKDYSSNKALREHEYNKHGIPKATHNCRLCTERFLTRSELLIHGRTHNTKGKNSVPVMEESEVKTGTVLCNICTEQFPSPVALVAHMQMHIGHGMGNGNMGIGNISNLKRETTPQSNCGEEAEHSSSLTCSICLRVFNSEGCLQRHIKMHATGKHVFYPCKTCGKKFVSESTYKTHMAKHVSESFYCSRCNKMFLNEELFKCHICENTEKRACLKCGTLLTEEQHLSHACDVNILKSLLLQERCNICPAVFSSIKARNNHMRIHGNQMVLPSRKKFVKMASGSYKCNICGRVTLTQQGAAGHSKMHSSAQTVKAYSCPFCNRKYSTQSGLYTHITVEHPELPGKLQ